MRTNKLFLLLPLMALLSVPVMAQFSLGAKTGMNFTNVQTPEILDLEFIPDFRTITTANFGVVGEMELHENFAIQSELNFTTKGFKIDEGLDLELFDVDIPLNAVAVSRFRYLEVPLLAKAKFGRDRVKGYVIAGPALGYATGGKLTTRAKVLVEFDLFSVPVNLEAIGYERLEISAMGGAGVAFETNNGQFFIDARYTHGFTEVYDLPLIQDRVQNRGVALNMGYLIRI